MAVKRSGLGLEAQEEPVTEPVKQEEPNRLRQGNQPLCPVHDVQMVSYSTTQIFTYYKCPNIDCKETSKRMRPVGPLKNRYGNGTSAQNIEQLPNIGN